jgi:hypothetical protein
MCAAKKGPDPIYVLLNVIPHGSAKIIHEIFMHLNPIDLGVHRIIS